MDKKIREVNDVKGLEDHEFAFDLLKQPNGNLGDHNSLLKVNTIELVNGEIKDLREGQISFRNAISKER